MNLRALGGMFIMGLGMNTFAQIPVNSRPVGTCRKEPQTLPCDNGETTWVDGACGADESGRAHLFCRN